MNLQAEKLEIIQRIIELQDDDLLALIKKIFRLQISLKPIGGILLLQKKENQLIAG
jgi:hypothetical protein